MPVLLSDEELEALDGLPYLHRCLYIFGIRRYMDYETGITGIKRKISYKSLSEEVYVTPHQGLKDTRERSIAQLKRAIKVLEKAGLITNHSIATKTEKQLILKCILATMDKSVQNKPVPNPYHSPVPEAAPVKNTENTVKKEVLEQSEEQSRPGTRTTRFPKAVPHPLSGKDTKLNYTYARENFAQKPVDNFLTPEENQFMNLFTDLRLTVKPAGDLKAIVAAKALVVAGVTIEEASEALKIKLNGYCGDRNPHPSYFTQAIIDYKRDLNVLKNQPSEVKHGQINQSTYSHSQRYPKSATKQFWENQSAILRQLAEDEN